MFNIVYVFSLEFLYCCCVFYFICKVDCYVQVVNEFVEYDLFWKGDDVDIVFFKVVIQQLQIFMFKYGVEVVVCLCLFNGFVLVYMMFLGSVEIEFDGCKVCIL